MQVLFKYIVYNHKISFLTLDKTLLFLSSPSQIITFPNIQLSKKTPTNPNIAPLPPNQIGFSVLQVV